MEDIDKRRRAKIPNYLFILNSTSAFEETVLGATLCI